MVTTTCPLCHTAIDVYQSAVNSKYKAKFQMPALAITQLIAVALGLDYKQAALHGNVVSAKKLLAPYFASKAQAAAAETPTA
jgi:succinate dehydrogenase / fumarate reductase cytochrome b subunit